MHGGASSLGEGEASDKISAHPLQDLCLPSPHIDHGSVQMCPCMTGRQRGPPGTPCLRQVYPTLMVVGDPPEATSVLLALACAPPKRAQAAPARLVPPCPDHSQPVEQARLQLTTLYGASSAVARCRVHRRGETGSAGRAVRRACGAGGWTMGACSAGSARAHSA